MPNYKAYRTQKTTPVRLTRKQARRTTFEFNRRITKLARKLRRSERAKQFAEANE